MVQDTILRIRLRNRIVRRIFDVVEDDAEVFNVSHFVRIAVLKELRVRGKLDV